MIEWQTERDKATKEYIQAKFKLNELLTVNNLLPLSLDNWLALNRTEQVGIYLTVLEEVEKTNRERTEERKRLELQAAQSNQSYKYHNDPVSKGRF